MARALLADGIGKATPISRGLLAKFTLGVNQQISTLKPNDWFGPSQPMPSVAPAGVQPRIWDYRFGQNLDYQPKGEEGDPYPILRDLADSYPLLRTIIETRKDQVSRVPFEITVRPVADEKPSDTKKRQSGDPRIEKLNKFFEKPDGYHNFADWQRMILEDMMVIDAPAVVPRWRNDGGIYGFDVIDGATISLLIDTNGRAPLPPDPAYRQIIKGVPACDMTQPDSTKQKTDQLFYFPRNVRTNRLYGYSPVEQVSLTVSLGLRRRIFQLQYYTDGTIPDSFINAPEGVSESNLTQLETMWNEKFSTTAARRKANFIPFGSKVTFAKTEVLADMMDELIIRELAFAFGISPGSLVKMVNRAAGAQMSEDAKAEGLEPILFWWKQFMDELFRFMGCGDLQYGIGSYTRENPLQAAQISQIYLSTIDADGNTVYRANDVREDLGMDPLDDDQDVTSDKNRQREMEDQQLMMEQQQRADTMRPKAAGGTRIALKKNAIEFRREQQRRDIAKLCSASRAY